MLQSGAFYGLVLEPGLDKLGTKDISRTTWETAIQTGC